MKERKTPKNCNECPFTKTCQSAFGNAGCEFKKDIENLVRKQV